MSTSSSTGKAREPRRERGQLRVAAIMEAGAALFREKGFEAVTMSDIAARSGTAFGSLYRFFPSKDALADALLTQYAQRSLDQLGALTEKAAEMSPEDLAKAMVAFMLGLLAERSFAVAVIEARGTGESKRALFRAELRDNLTALLRLAIPGLSAANGKAVAIVTLNVLKGVAAAAEESAAQRRLLLAQYEALLGAYYASLRGSA